MKGCKVQFKESQTSLQLTSKSRNYVHFLFYRNARAISILFQMKMYSKSKTKAFYVVYIKYVPIHYLFLCHLFLRKGTLIISGEGLSIKKTVGKPPYGHEKVFISQMLDYKTLVEIGHLKVVVQKEAKKPIFG